MIGVTLVSLLAAFFFGLSAALQQRAAQQHPERNALSLMRRLVRSRTWIMGQASDLCGFLSQAAALSLGSVGVVQPLITTELAFGVGISDVAARRRPHWSTIAGALAVCAGLAVFLSFRGALVDDELPDRGRLFFLAPFVVGGVLGAIAVTRRLPPLPSAILLGVAAGALFACSAVLIKLTSYDLFHRGVGATATDWPGYTLAASTASGLLLEQLAFAAGPLAPGMTAMTITNPVVSYVFAVFAFHSPLPDSPGALSAFAAGGFLVAVGVTLVSRSAATLQTEQRHPQEPANRSVVGAPMAEST